MALSNFIPAVWSARALVNLNKTLVYGNIVNRDFEGDIREKGDTVKINSIGAVTVGSYTKDVNIGDPQTLTDAQTTLLINQADYVNFQIDDVDRAQQTPKVMDIAMRESAYGIANAADSYIAGLYTGVAVGNTIGDDIAPIVPTATTAYEKLVDLSTLLDEANVPSEDRWVVLPPWYYGLLLKDDRFVKAGTSAADQALRNGLVGEAAGLMVYKSNNVPNAAAAKYKIIAGQRRAISFADQISSIEAYRPEKRFADAVKGLHLYGAKLVYPSAIAVLTANKS